MILKNYKLESITAAVSSVLILCVAGTFWITTSRRKNEEARRQEEQRQEAEAEAQRQEKEAEAEAQRQRYLNFIKRHAQPHRKQLNSVYALMKKIALTKLNETEEGKTLLSKYDDETRLQEPEEAQRQESQLQVDNEDEDEKRHIYLNDILSNDSFNNISYFNKRRKKDAELARESLNETHEGRLLLSDYDEYRKKQLLTYLSYIEKYDQSHEIFLNSTYKNLADIGREELNKTEEGRLLLFEYEGEKKQTEVLKKLKDIDASKTAKTLAAVESDRRESVEEIIERLGLGLEKGGRHRTKSRSRSRNNRKSSLTATIKSVVPSCRRRRY